MNELLRWKKNRRLGTIQKSASALTRKDTLVPLPDLHLTGLRREETSEVCKDKRKPYTKKVCSSFQECFNKQNKVQRICLTARGIPEPEFHYSLSPSFEEGPEGRR